MSMIADRSFSPVGSLVLFFVTLLVAMACNSEMRLSYHVVKPGADAIPQVADMCRTGEARPFSYKFPNGNGVELMASATAAFSVNIGPKADIRLIRMSRGGGNDGELVTVIVVPSTVDMTEAAGHRDRLEWCDLLVIVGNAPVGVVYGGTGGWKDGVPGGTFDSYESAEKTYSALGANLSREVSTRAADERDAELSKWLLLRNAWEFHCNEETKAAIKAKDRSAYDRLMAEPAPDCEQPPEAPR